MHTPGFAINDCGTNELWGSEAELSAFLDHLLPDTSSWYLRPRGGVRIQSMWPTTTSSQSTEQISNSTHTQSSCQIVIHIGRTPWMFALERLFPQFLVVQGGMLALWLSPRAPPLVGGRCGLLVTAMLLVSNRLSNPTQIQDAVNYPGWIHIFSVCQISMLVAALLETMVVHQLLSIKQEALAMTVDETMRVAMPWFYLQLIGWLLLFAIIQDGGGAALLVTVGFINFWFTWISVSCVIRRKYHTLKLMQRSALVKASSFAGTDEAGTPEAKAATKEAFTMFDIDNSGSLDHTEMVELLQALMPHFSKKRINQMMREEMDFPDDHTMQEGTQFEEFLGSLKNWLALIEQPSKIASKSSSKDLLPDVLTEQLSRICSDPNIQARSNRKRRPSLALLQGQRNSRGVSYARVGTMGAAEEEICTVAPEVREGSKLMDVRGSGNALRRGSSREECLEAYTSERRSTSALPGRVVNRNGRRLSLAQFPLAQFPPTSTSPATRKSSLTSSSHMMPLATHLPDPDCARRLSATTLLQTLPSPDCDRKLSVTALLNSECVQRSSLAASNILTATAEHPKANTVHV